MAGTTAMQWRFDFDRAFQKNGYSALSSSDLIIFPFPSDFIVLMAVFCWNVVKSVKKIDNVKKRL